MYDNPRPDLPVKPCPFCGDDHIELRTNADESSHWVICDCCGAQQGGHGEEYTWEEVTRLWNARASSWPDWTDSEVGLPDPDAEVLVEVGAFHHVAQIVTVDYGWQRTKPPYWVPAGTGASFIIKDTRWMPLPKHRVDEAKK